MERWMDGYKKGFDPKNPKLVRFKTIKFLIALKLNFNGGYFIKKYQILILSKSGKNS